MASLGYFVSFVRGHVHVVPSASKNSIGSLAVRRSLLDASISIPDGERTALEMLRAITGAMLGNAARVTVGTVPLNLLSQTQVRGAAANEVARTVLMRTLEATKKRLSWSLLCDLAPSRQCALNIYVVRRATK